MEAASNYVSSSEDDEPPDLGNDRPRTPPPKPARKQNTLDRWVVGAEALAAPEPAPAEGWLLIDLFCSVGGVSAAAAAEGHTVVLAIDMEQWRLDVHAANHPHARHECLKLGAGARAGAGRGVAVNRPILQRRRRLGRGRRRGAHRCSSY